MAHIHRKKKTARAYGAKRELVWCDKCDQELVVPEPNKKRARQASKKIVNEARQF